jgi:hypothetical protein
LFASANATANCAFCFFDILDSFCLRDDCLVRAHRSDVL